MDNDFEKLYEEKIVQANNLIEELHNLTNVRGVAKLKKLIIAERNFIHKVATSDNNNVKYLSTTNLTHFEALVSTALGEENCVAVLEPFTFHNEDISKRIVVDIVKDEGKEWIKVTARNPKGLMMSCLGDTNYGSRTILDQAQDFIDCASQNPVFYLPPKVTFKFSSGLDSALATKIQKLGIEVVGELFPVSIDTRYSSDDEEDEKEQEQNKSKQTEAGSSHQESSSQVAKANSRGPILKLNLDITAMIAYVSDMTNGGTCLSFIQEPLTLQAKSEQSVKVKEILDKLFDGKYLYCCETAMIRFKEILETVGGEREKERAKHMFGNIEVVPDCVSERVKNLRNGGQIKERPKAVFGTGDSMQGVTVSANWGFCRSAQHQGVQLATFLHEPRALSEQASNVSQNRLERSYVEQNS